MSLFDHGKPEEFFLFVGNFKMTLMATGVLETDAKVQYFHTLARGDKLSQFGLLSADVDNTDTSITVDYLLKGLAWYFPSVNLLSKKKRAIRLGMKKLKHKGKALCSTLN